MSAPAAETILLAVAACCALPDGTGDYNNDLTAAGVVAIDEVFKGPAQVIVFLPDVARDQSIRLLASVDRTATVYVQGSVGMQSSYQARIIAALRLAGDLSRAIEGNLRAQVNVLSANLGNTIVRIELSVAQQSGLSEGGLGSFVMVVTVAYRVANNRGI